MKGHRAVVVGSLAVAAIALLVNAILQQTMTTDSAKPTPELQDAAAAPTPDGPDAPAPVAAPAPDAPGSATADAAPAPPTPDGNDASTDPRHARRLEVERAIRAAREARERWLAEQSSSSGTGAPVASADAGDGRSGLSQDYIRDRIRELHPLLRDCYDLALHEDPTLEGKLVVEFVIGGEPEVGAIVEESRILDDSTLRHPALDECVRETMYMAEFEDPPAGGRVTVTYPFLMTRPAAEPPRP